MSRASAKERRIGLHLLMTPDELTRWLDGATDADIPLADFVRDSVERAIEAERDRQAHDGARARKTTAPAESRALEIELADYIG